jgi:hypothetical protein
MFDVKSRGTFDIAETQEINEICTDKAKDSLEACVRHFIFCKY